MLAVAVAGQQPMGVSGEATRLFEGADDFPQTVCFTESRSPNNSRERVVGLVVMKNVIEDFGSHVQGTPKQSRRHLAARKVKNSRHKRPTAPNCQPQTTNNTNTVHPRQQTTDSRHDFPAIESTNQQANKSTNQQIKTSTK